MCDCEEECEQMRDVYLFWSRFFIEEWQLDVWDVFGSFVSTESLLFLIVSLEN
jgi:hypothetical protein